MGGACSRKREQGDPENEEVGIHAGPVGKLSRSISLRWPLKLTTMQKSESFTKHRGSLSTPSLLELSVQAVCQVKYPRINRHHACRFQGNVEVCMKFFPNKLYWVTAMAGICLCCLV